MTYGGLSPSAGRRWPPPPTTARRCPPPGWTGPAGRRHRTSWTTGSSRTLLARVTRGPTCSRPRAARPRREAPAGAGLQGSDHLSCHRRCRCDNTRGDITGDLTEVVSLGRQRDLPTSANRAAWCAAQGHPPPQPRLGPGRTAGHCSTPCRPEVCIPEVCIPEVCIPEVCRRIGQCSAAFSPAASRPRQHPASAHTRLLPTASPPRRPAI